MAEIFAVTTYNLDVPSEGYTIHQYFKEKQHAYQACAKWIKDKQGKKPVIDFGTLTHFDGKLLEYTLCKNKTVIYYHSNYGNYKCVVFINPITVH